MWRSILNIKYLNNTEYKLACIQCVRWYRRPRKPLWKGPAPSKMFRIPQKPQIPEYEDNQLCDLARYHDTYIRQLMIFFKEDYEKLEAEKEKQGTAVFDTEEDRLRRLKENDEWNAQIAKMREERLKIEAEARREEILKKLIEAEEYEKQRQKQIRERVLQVKKNSKMFITRKNIDEAIEAALANEVDYNYAIDLSGNIYRGRMTKPRDIPPDNLENILPKEESSQSEIETLPEIKVPLNKSNPLSQVIP